MENVEPMQRWWLSDASKPFRVAKADPEPQPPSTGGQAAAPPQATAHPRSPRTSAQPAAWWMLSGLILLALAAIFRATRKRKI
jgi:LPXTG-motif cell wall-anchored protein